MNSFIDLTEEENSQHARRVHGAAVDLTDSLHDEEEQQLQQCIILSLNSGQPLNSPDISIWNPSRLEQDTACDGGSSPEISIHVPWAPIVETPVEVPVDNNTHSAASSSMRSSALPAVAAVDGGDFEVSGVPLQKRGNPIADAIVANLVSMGFDIDQASSVSEHCSTLDSAVKYLLCNTCGEKDHSPTYPCPICMDHFDMSEMITLSCLHRMCVDCFDGYCSVKISDGEVLPSQLCCPALFDDGSNKACNVPITIHEIKARVTTEIFDKYERFTTRAFCENENLRCCPKCNEWYIDLSDALDIETLWCKIRCGNCNHPFCGKCGQAPHKNQHDQNISCEKMALWLEENSKSDESLSSYMKENKLFPCPKCKMAAELSSGCKFFYCRCKANFCALCGISLTEKDHFAHFQGAPGCTGPFGQVCRGSATSAPTVATSAAKIYNNHKVNENIARPVLAVAAPRVIRPRHRSPPKPLMIPPPPPRKRVKALPPPPRPARAANKKRRVSKSEEE